jgi:hypothetical protein
VSKNCGHSSLNNYNSYNKTASCIARRFIYQLPLAPPPDERPPPNDPLDEEEDLEEDELKLDDELLLLSSLQFRTGITSCHVLL